MLESFELDVLVRTCIRGSGPSLDDNLAEFEGPPDPPFEEME